MSGERDRDLERRFAELRSADARHAPAFATVLAGRPAPRRKALWPMLATSAALLTLVAIWRLTATPEPPFVIRAGELRVPTDYLLDFVSAPRAGEIPEIGIDNWFPLEPYGHNRRQQ